MSTPLFWTVILKSSSYPNNNHLRLFSFSFGASTYLTPLETPWYSCSYFWISSLSLYLSLFPSPCPPSSVLVFNSLHMGALFFFDFTGKSLFLLFSRCSLTLTDYIFTFHWLLPFKGFVQQVSVNMATLFLTLQAFINFSVVYIITCLFTSINWDAYDYVNYYFLFARLKVSAP